MCFFEYQAKRSFPSFIKHAIKNNKNKSNQSKQWKIFTLIPPPPPKKNNCQKRCSLVSHLSVQPHQWVTKLRCSLLVRHIQTKSVWWGFSYVFNFAHNNCHEQTISFIIRHYPEFDQQTYPCNKNALPPLRSNCLIIKDRLNLASPLAVIWPASSPHSRPLFTRKCFRSVLFSA